MTFTHRHFLGIEGLGKDELLFLLDTAESFREISEREVKKVPTLRGKTVINLFYESSTRTVRRSRSLPSVSLPMRSISPPRPVVSPRGRRCSIRRAILWP